MVNAGRKRHLKVTWVRRSSWWLLDVAESAASAEGGPYDDGKAGGDRVSAAECVCQVATL